MPIDIPKSDLSRSVQHEQNRVWPHAVKIAVHWMDSEGKILVRTEVISAAQFFGEEGFGAPLTGDFIISLIDRMRRTGPPVVKRLQKAKGKR